MMLTQTMLDSINYLEENNFILKNPTSKSIELRNIAAEYAKEIASKDSKIVAIVLTGSSTGGYSGSGSDIDMDVLIDGKTRPIIKTIYKGIPIDLQYKSYNDWKDDCINCRESVKFLTHTVPIYDKIGEFLSFQKEILIKYYSDDSIKRKYQNVINMVEERGSLGVAEAKLGQLVPSAIRIESVLYEAISFLIYRHRGYTATSLILSELCRISAELGHSEWFDKTTKYMRFDIVKDEYYELLNVYDELFKIMRDKINHNMDLVKRIKKMKLGLFCAGNQLTELCSQTNYQQLYDKVERAILKDKEYEERLKKLFIKDDAGNIVGISKETDISFTDKEKEQLKKFIKSNAYTTNDLARSLRYKNDFEEYQHGIMSAFLLIKTVQAFKNINLTIEDVNKISLSEINLSDVIAKQTILRTIADHTSDSYQITSIQGHSEFLILIDEIEEFSRISRANQNRQYVNEFCKTDIYTKDGCLQVDFIFDNTHIDNLDPERAFKDKCRRFLTLFKISKLSENLKLKIRYIGQLPYNKRTYMLEIAKKYANITIDGIEQSIPEYLSSSQFYTKEEYLNM